MDKPKSDEEKTIESHLYEDEKITDSIPCEKIDEEMSCTMYITDKRIIFFRRKIIRDFPC